MKTYSLLFRGGIIDNSASPEEMQGVMMKWKTWMDAMAADGRMVSPGHRLTRVGAVVKECSFALARNPPELFTRRGFGKKTPASWLDLP